MKFKFVYAEWQEDEGAEIEMYPGIKILDKKDMDEESVFESYMKGYSTFALFIETQLLKVNDIKHLEKQMKEILINKGSEIIFFVKLYSDDEKDAWKFVINANETKFFKPHRNVENDEHFHNTAIPTELFLALLKEWKIYIESGSQEEKIVDIPFAYDEALYRSTGKIQRKQ